MSAENIPKIPLRILVFSPTPTAPIDYGNRKRIHAVCTWLKRAGSTIDFAYYPFESDWRIDPSESVLTQMRKDWHSVDVIPVTRERIQSSAAGFHHKIDEWWDHSIGDYIRWKMRQTHYHAVIANYTFYSKLFEYVPKRVVKILDTHDLFSGRRELFESLGAEPEFFYTNDEEEKVGIDRADIIWVIKDQEAAHYQKISNNKKIITLIHHEGNSRSLPITPRKNRAFLKVGFLGARNTINIKNLTRFLEAAIPVFRQHMAPLKLYIAGSICQDINLPSSPWYETVGMVDNAVDFYASIDIAIVPIEKSTGLKIKVGEALECGVGVICHKHAFEGYLNTHKWHTIESFESMAIACIQAANQPELADQLQSASLKASSLTKQKFENALLDTANQASIKQQ